MDMEQRDYDSRTALHVAAAEGKNTDTAVNVSDDQCVCVCVCVCVQGADVCVSVCVSGHAEVVRFLLEACKVNPVPKDR